MEWPSWLMLRDYFSRTLWAHEPAGTHTVRLYLRHLLRICSMVFRGFQRDLVLMRASSLTFATLLSLVPVFALAFALLRGMGWEGRRLQTLILEQVPVLTQSATDTIVSYVDNTNIASMSLVGGVMIFAVVLSVMANIERSFNAIWQGLPQRSIFRKFTDYLSVIVAMPLLLGAATMLTASVQVQHWMQTIDETVTVVNSQHVWAWGANGLVCVLFAGFYMYMPNTRVRPTAALIGGSIAGIAWMLTQWGYLRFQFGMANYNALYGAMAQLPILMIWIYVSWVILLVGGEVTHAIQNVDEYARHRRARAHQPADRERSALLVLIELGKVALGQHPPTSPVGLARRTDLPFDVFSTIVEKLAAGGLVLQDTEKGWIHLSQAPSAIPLVHALNVLRGGTPATNEQEASPLDKVLDKLAVSRQTALEQQTVADLILD